MFDNTMQGWGGLNEFTTNFFLALEMYDFGCMSMFHQGILRDPSQTWKVLQLMGKGKGYTSPQFS